MPKFRLAKSKYSSQEEMEEYNKKLRKHKMKVAIIICSVIVIVLLIVLGLYIYAHEKKFTGFKTVKTFEKEENSSAKYDEFKGKLLRYSKDGIAYYDENNNAIWSQAYEMQEPMIDKCGDYVIVADMQGTSVYIQNTTETVGKIDTGMKIEQVKVSAQGTVFAIVADNQTKYMRYYDSSGEVLAEGKVQLKKSGYAMDYDLSDDGKKLAVSYLYVSNGIMKSNIVFYNFDTVGQNEIDNIVSSYSYEGLVVPDIEFFGNDRAIAFGDNHIYIYVGSEKPVLATDIAVDSEINSIFYNDEYFGIICKNTDAETSKKALIYKLNGSKANEFGFSMEYDKIKFANNNIVMNSDNEFAIYKFDGTLRFDGSTDNLISEIIPTDSILKYILVTPESTNIIKMK